MNTLTGMILTLASFSGPLAAPGILWLAVGYALFITAWRRKPASDLLWPLTPSALAIFWPGVLVAGFAVFLVLLPATGITMPVSLTVPVSLTNAGLVWLVWAGACGVFCLLRGLAGNRTGRSAGH